VARATGASTPATDFVAIAAGFKHSLAFTKDDAVPQGANDFGQAPHVVSGVEIVEAVDTIRTIRIQSGQASEARLSAAGVVVLAPDVALVPVGSASVAWARGGCRTPLCVPTMAAACV